MPEDLKREERLVFEDKKLPKPDCVGQHGKECFKCEEQRLFIGRSPKL